MKNEKSASDHTLDVTLKRVDELHHQVEELKAQLLTKGNHKKWDRRVRHVPGTSLATNNLRSTALIFRVRARQTLVF